MEARIKIRGQEECFKVQPSFLSSVSKSHARTLFRKEGPVYFVSDCHEKREAVSGFFLWYFSSVFYINIEVCEFKR